jgi:hypothetical protein
MKFETITAEATIGAATANQDLLPIAVLAIEATKNRAAGATML